MDGERGISRRSPELVVGLVGAAGADLDSVTRMVRSAVAPMGYETIDLRLSELLHDVSCFANLSAAAPEDDRIAAHQDAGNGFRERMERGDAVALLAVAAIRRIRKQRNAEWGNAADAPLVATAFILRSLKTREEVETLRRIYGNAFVALGIHSAATVRADNLAQKIALSRHDPHSDRYKARAHELLIKDQEEPGKRYGQDVAHAFPEADVFFGLDQPFEPEKDMARFFNLYFGHPFITPTRDEFAMFLAHAVALRSADLSRQVGAVIVADEGDVVAVGTNEVPKAGGGLYWEGDQPDGRDFRQGANVSVQYRRSALAEVFERLSQGRWLRAEFEGKTVSELADQARELMAGTQIMGSGEYGRMVHAEMAALMDAARRGAATQGLRLVTNLFPCHNCTKHIVAAGLKEVIFLHPYLKSLAFQLHGDSVEAEQSGSGHRVWFRPFIGVGPRKYTELFRMRRRKSADDELIRWEPQAAAPCLHESVTAILEREGVACAELNQLMKRADLSYAP
ncbi:MAG: hypothetical protein ABFD65_12960, partial [Candidatus Polarisedimenticolia bacterium]